jgi:hypothetical protein
MWSRQDPLSKRRLVPQTYTKQVLAERVAANTRMSLQVSYRLEASRHGLACAACALPAPDFGPLQYVATASAAVQRERVNQVRSNHGCILNVKPRPWLSGGGRL